MDETTTNQVPVADEPLRLEEVEQLFEDWRKSREERASEGKSRVVLRAPRKVADMLSRLKLGPAPPGLHERVQEIWAAFQDRWTSREMLSELEQAFVKLGDALRETERKLISRESELKVRRKRVESLQALAEILDEILRSSRDEEQTPEAGQSHSEGEP